MSNEVRYKVITPFHWYGGPDGRSRPNPIVKRFDNLKEARKYKRRIEKYIKMGDALPKTEAQERFVNRILDGNGYYYGKSRLYEEITKEIE